MFSKLEKFGNLVQRFKFKPRTQTKVILKFKEKIKTKFKFFLNDFVKIKKNCLKSFIIH
jgi:hypothetical protein